MHFQSLWQQEVKIGVLHFFLSAFREGDPDRLLLPTDSNGNQTTCKILNFIEVYNTLWSHIHAVSADDDSLHTRDNMLLYVSSFSGVIN